MAAYDRVRLCTCERGSHGHSMRCASGMRLPWALAIVSSILERVEPAAVTIRWPLELSEASDRIEYIGSDRIG
mgnify:CR=1 FL=1